MHHLQISSYKRKSITFDSVPVFPKATVCNTRSRKAVPLGILDKILPLFGRRWFFSFAIESLVPQHHYFGAWGLFLEIPETFRVYFGCRNSFYIFGTPKFFAIKLGNPLGFSCIKNILKDQLFKTSRLKFDNCVFWPEKFSGLSRNRPGNKNPKSISLVDDIVKLRQRRLLVFTVSSRSRRYLPQLLLSLSLVICKLHFYLLFRKGFFDILILFENTCSVSGYMILSVINNSQMERSYKIGCK